MAVTEYETQRLTLTSLWTDTRYRSITMQILVLAGLFATVFVLVSNAIDNLAALDKDVGFDFLSQPAQHPDLLDLFIYHMTLSDGTHFFKVQTRIFRYPLVILTSK